MYLHAKLHAVVWRTVLFFLFCMRATLLFCSNSNLFKLLYNLVFKPSACTASSLSSYFAIQDAEEVVLHFCIHFLSPQAAEALQVAAWEAREVSVAITCVEPRSPHAQAARGRISSMDLCASRTNRHFTYTPTTTGYVSHCASWPEEEEAVQRPTSEYSKVLCNCVIQGACGPCFQDRTS